MPTVTRVIIIDDEKDFCFFVKQNLEATGEFEVLTAYDGVQGIELIKTTRPDLVLLDIVMPEVSGPDVAEYLLNSPDLKGIPFIFLTAIVTKDELDRESTKDARRHSFIQKPVDTKTLLVSIRAVLKVPPDPSKTCSGPGFRHTGTVV